MALYMDPRPLLRLISTSALVAALASCGPEPVPNEPVGTPPPPPTRPADGLLGDAALQHVVDLQVQRDGRGLRALLESDDPAVRARTAFALGSVQDPDAAQKLRALLFDPDPSVRRDAAFALGQLSDPASGPSLLGALREETDPLVRDRILEALGKTGDARALEQLLSMEVPVNENAARNLAVARMGIRGVVLPTSILHLVSALRDPDVRARTDAAYFFGRSNNPGSWSPQAGAVRAALDSLPPSDPAAMHLLLGLAALGDPQDTPRFVWWLQSSSDWRIRANAARALSGRATDPRVRAGLLESMEDPNTNVAVYAAEAFASTDGLAPDEEKTLMDWVEDHPGQWRRAGPILALLGRIGRGPFIQGWLDRWPEDSIAPRTRGLGALAFVPGDEATRYLLDAAGSANSRIRGTALGGLARRWRLDRSDPEKAEEYFQAFAGGLRTGDPASVFVSAPALADSVFLPMGSVELLEEEYGRLSLPDDLEGMQAILRALGATGSPQAKAFLGEQVRVARGALRQSAVRALASLTGEELGSVSEVGGAERNVDWPALHALGPRPRMVLETEKGTVTLVLDAESAPLTVQTVLGFAQDGLYDDVPFHRVVPNFVVQGGDFARHDGFGGPGFSIRSEFTEIPFHRGVVGMASSGKDTEGSQFFLTHSMQPHLDGGYTSFGWVVEGMDVVDHLYEEDVLVAARVEPDGSRK